MKTLLFIGVLVAVISWSSALECWGGSGEGDRLKNNDFWTVTSTCSFSGKTVDKTKCKKVKCPTKAKVCYRETVTDLLSGEFKTGLGCGKIDLTIGCRISYVVEMPDNTKNWNCWCKTPLCNGADGIPYTHLIVAVIVGAIFFH